MYFYLPSTHFEADGGGVNARVGPMDLFWFALATTTGLGVAPCRPTQGVALAFANLQRFVIDMLMVFLTTVIFTRLSQPTLLVRISDVLLYATPHMGTHAMLTRFYFENDSTGGLMDVSLELILFRLVKYNDGSSHYKFDHLSLTRPHIPTLNVGTSVTHLIDQDSPLYEISPEEAEVMDIGFQLSIMGLERSTAQTVQFNKFYRFIPRNEDHGIVKQGKFKDMFAGSVLNLDHISTLEEE